MLPLFSISYATVRFLNTTLFSSLNFMAYRGHHYALIGESGSGKSALLQTVAGRFNITGGDIKYHFFDGYLKSGEHDPSVTFHKMIALVESRHHFRNLSNTTDFYYQQRYNSSDSEDAATVEEYLGSIVTGRKNDYWTFEKVVALLKLALLRDKQLIKLSNGETKRLMLAAALLKNPVLLLLDNPLVGLDVQTRSAFDAILGEVAASGI